MRKVNDDALKKVFVFGHMHHITSLWQKFLETPSEKILFLDSLVAPFFEELNRGVTPFEKFVQRPYKVILLRFLINYPRYLFQTPVDLYTADYMGDSLFYALTKFRVKRVIFVHNYSEFPHIETMPKQFKITFMLCIVSALSRKKLTYYQFGDVLLPGVREAQFAPPKKTDFLFPIHQHDFDLIILDFELDGFPIKLDESLERIFNFVNSFRNPVIKPHPTLPAGIMQRNTSLLVMESWRPAETLTSNSVSCLALKSSATKFFHSQISVLDFLVFLNLEDQVAWSDESNLSWLSDGRQWKWKLSS